MVLLVAGVGVMEPYIRKWVNENGISACVQLLGEIPHEQIYRFFQLSDIFLYTATAGGTLAASVLEAMSCGCVVVATNRPRTHGQILNGTNGYVIRAGDTNSIYERLTDILNRKDEMNKIGLEAAKWVQENNSIQALRKYLLII